MATSSVMQSLLVSPVTGVAKGMGLSWISPWCYVPHQQRMDGKKKAPPSKAKVSTDFFDVFAFSGPAPERINGRLAMIGFVAAIILELSKGEDLFA